MIEILTIDRIEELNLEALRELLKALAPEAPAPMIKGVEAIVADPKSALLVARLEGEVVGMTTVACYDTLTARRGWVEDVAVSPAARGRGVGRALIAEAKAWARRNGVETLSLTSAPHREAARRLYQREGFLPIPTGLFRLKIK